jgi:hypothetical protein
MRSILRKKFEQKYQSFDFLYFLHLSYLPELNSSFLNLFYAL